MDLITSTPKLINLHIFDANASGLHVVICKWTGVLLVKGPGTLQRVSLYIWVDHGHYLEDLEVAVLREPEEGVAVMMGRLLAQVG